MTVNKGAPFKVAQSYSSTAGSDDYTNNSVSLVYIAPTDADKDISYKLCYTASDNLVGQDLPAGMFQHWYKIYNPEYNIYTNYI